MMSPHGEVDRAKERSMCGAWSSTFVRNSAIGTLVLCALSGWLLFPARRPRWPVRD